MRDKIHVYVVISALVITLIIGVFALSRSANEDIVARLRQTDLSSAQSLISEQRYSSSLVASVNGSQIIPNPLWIGTSTNAQNSFLAASFDNVSLPKK